jgi:hypothetical protein
VSERAGAKAGGSNPFATSQYLRVRCGERHPGLREGRTLRGALSERGSWSARKAVVVPPRRRRADDSGCPSDAEEGNAVWHAQPTHVHPAQARKTVPALRRRVLHSVRRPVHVNPHYASGASSMVGRWRWHRGWANHASGRNQHRGHRKRTERGSPRVDAPAREAARHVREGRRSRPPSLRGSRARVWLLARRMYVAEVRRRRMVSNTLGKRAPKRAARVE